jgi:hypothetical protein
MGSRIYSFTLDKIYWKKFGKGVVSFDYYGMPEDVHLSIVYNVDMSFMNLHATRNIDNLRFKPKVEIARISKEDLTMVEPALCRAYFYTALCAPEVHPRGRPSPQSYYSISYFPLIILTGSGLWRLTES